MRVRQIRITHLQSTPPSPRMDDALQCSIRAASWWSILKTTQRRARGIREKVYSTIPPSSTLAPMDQLKRGMRCGVIPQGRAGRLSRRLRDLFGRFTGVCLLPVT
jgi:hypothetical protein